MLFFDTNIEVAWLWRLMWKTFVLLRVALWLGGSRELWQPRVGTATLRPLTLLAGTCTPDLQNGYLRWHDTPAFVTSYFATSRALSTRGRNRTLDTPVEDTFRALSSFSRQDCNGQRHDIHVTSSGANWGTTGLTTQTHCRCSRLSIIRSLWGQQNASH